MLDKPGVFTEDSVQEPQGEMRLTLQGDGVTPACAVVTLVEGTCLVNSLCLLGGCNNHTGSAKLDHTLSKAFCILLEGHGMFSVQIEAMTQG